MRHAQALPHFESKIEMRRFLAAHGGPTTPTIFSSNSDPHIRDHIADKKDYVVKATHLSEGQHVFLVREGRLVKAHDLNGTGSQHVETIACKGIPSEQCTGSALAEYIEGLIVDSFSLHAMDAESAKLVDATLGVMVEELVLGDDGAVCEVQCLTTWGKCVSWNLAKCDVDKSCLDDVRLVIERAAFSLRADFVRVDVLIRGQCEAVFLSEVEIYPGNQLSRLEQMKLMRSFLHGYGFDYQFEPLQKKSACLQWTEFEMDEIELLEFRDVMSKSVFTSNN